MSDFCFVTTCMGRLPHLKQTLGRLVAQSQASTIVVDYSCPQRCGDWVEREFPMVSVKRVEGKTRFNLANARNTGAENVTAKWLCFIDADVIVASDFCARVIPLLKLGNYYRATPIVGELCGTVICETKSFISTGGYDEVLQGWGGDDYDLYNRLRIANVTPANFPGELLRPISHSKEVRVQNYDIKDPQFSWKINQIYIQAKIDIMKIVGHPLSLSRRVAIYRKIATFVANAHKVDGVNEFVLQVRTTSTAANERLDTSLVYSVSPKEKVKSTTVDKKSRET